MSGVVCVFGVLLLLVLVANCIKEINGIIRKGIYHDFN